MAYGPVDYDRLARKLEGMLNAQGGVYKVSRAPVESYLRVRLIPPFGERFTCPLDYVHEGVFLVKYQKPDGEAGMFISQASEVFPSL